MKTLFLFFAALFISASVANAQNEVLRQRESLNGLLEFGVVVNVEQPIGDTKLDISPAEVKAQMLNPNYSRMDTKWRSIYLVNNPG
ncbi:MAG: hypothetical protein FH748_00135 [Balneolaceae bacterium]|nr:hypothetical protein [Balneolaceae bacterium]